ncbi:unnamed protein product [Cylicocyclus nassatus]|uniref:Lipase_GDSL domain-containing protein n=1 Tax=Cylicocyclus nassatus TaxID=53992 RepID=A0AA36HAY4_CYLNA|nr:unnamed protein product [Cylicocyclus nassatus]
MTHIYCFLFILQLFILISCDSHVRFNDKEVYNRGSAEDSDGRTHYRGSLSVRNKEDDDDDNDDDDDDSSRSSKNLVVGQISSAFSNKQSFSCPRAKPLLHTGETLADLSPEDIDIVAAMGDALPAGRGLWEGTLVEFRGAAFPIGGDANIDGLVTIPNILLEFNEQVEGVSHGMGKRSRLPDYQLNVAESNTETEDLPEQATELVRRLRSIMTPYELSKKWVLLVIATGTEEFCNRCETPSHSSIRRAMGILRKAIPKLFVVLLGPVHVASSRRTNINVLKSRCRCLETISMTKYRSLVHEWKDVFVQVQNEFNSLKYATFGVLAIARLPIHSREPESLLVPGKPLLNRKGHTYAAKWLWNRLLAGPTYNFSNVVFSEDSYFCPSVGCPYFRTVQNLERCTVMLESDYQRLYAATKQPANGTTKTPHRVVVRNNLLEIIALVVSLCFISVSVLGTYFYCRSRKATVGRFEVVPEEGTTQ